MWKVKNIGRKLTFNNSTIQLQSRLNLLEGKYNDKQAEFGYPWCGGKDPFFLNDNLIYIWDSKDINIYNPLKVCHFYFLLVPFLYDTYCISYHIVCKKFCIILAYHKYSWIVRYSVCIISIVLYHKIIRIIWYINKCFKIRFFC